MSLNSAATVEGLEIGRAQALQAEAAGVAPSVHMNPVLIKPADDNSSQVIAHRRIWGTVSAANYYQRRVEELLPVVRESYEVLASESLDMEAIFGWVRLPYKETLAKREKSHVSQCGGVA